MALELASLLIVEIDLISPALECHLDAEIGLAFEEHIPEPNALCFLVKASHTLEVCFTPVVEERSTSAGLHASADHVVNSALFVQIGECLRVPFEEIVPFEMFSSMTADSQTPAHCDLLTCDMRCEVLDLLVRITSDTGCDA